MLGDVIMWPLYLIGGGVLIGICLIVVGLTCLALYLIRKNKLKNGGYPKDGEVFDEKTSANKDSKQTDSVGKDGE